MAATSSLLEETSSMPAACSLAPWARVWLEEAISSAALFTWLAAPRRLPLTRKIGLLTRLAAEHGDQPPVREFLAGPFGGFRLNRRAPAVPGCRVVFDCRGMLGGQTVAATEARYQEAVLDDQAAMVG